MPTITPCARASLPPSNANCSSGAASPHRSRHAWPASASSKASTILPGGTPPWGIARPFATNRKCKQTNSPPPPEPSTKTGQLQSDKKDEINDSEVKIGADELPAVTQLFTEDYMVEFLLHNTLGAWWVGKQGPITARSEEEARRAVALPTNAGLPGITWSYLRFVQDETTKSWTPAA